MSKRKGMTLIELLVYMSILGVVMAGVYGVLVSGMNYFRIARIQTDLQYNTLNAVSRLSNDLAEANNGSVVLENQNIAYSSGPESVTAEVQQIMFPMPKSSLDDMISFDSRGMVIWKKWVCYYLEPGDNHYNLVKKEIPIPEGEQWANPGDPPYPSVQEFALDDLDNSIIVARGIINLQIVRTTNPRRYNLLITADQTHDPTKPNRITVETEISLRN